MFGNVPCMAFYGRPHSRELVRICWLVNTLISLLRLNDYFANLCYDDSYVRPIDMDIPDSVKPPQISERCVWNTLADLKKTATGPDNLPYWIWKECAELLTPVVTHVWNLSLSTHT